MRVLSFPFRFNEGQPTSFVTTEHGSNEYKAQQIEAFMKTHRGERPLYADFGINDPTFSDRAISQFDDTSFVSEFATFYGNIVLDRVTVVASDGALSKIEVEFT